MVVTIVAKSDIGNYRGNNEDNLLFLDRVLPLDHIGTEGLLKASASVSMPLFLAAFDGMGGEANGEVASYAAAKDLLNWISEHPHLGKMTDVSLLDACVSMNDAVCNATKQYKSARMGTTIAMVVLTKEKLLCCNVGDSKVFSWKSGTLTQVSIDHNNEDMLKQLGIQEKKPQLTQYIGVPPNVFEIQPSIRAVPYNVIKRFLICSDGLTDMVSIEDITDIMSGTDIGDVCNNLVDAANDAGGHDNITVIVGEIQQPAFSGVSESEERK